VNLGFVAHVVFWVLLLLGKAQVGPRLTLLLLVLWFAGFLASRWSVSGAPLFASCVAIADIVLLLVLVRGDVRLT
jgi:hypothetical protein